MSRLHFTSALLLAALLVAPAAMAQDADTPAKPAAEAAAPAAKTTSSSKSRPAIVHPKIGETVSTPDGKLRLTLVGKKQNYRVTDDGTRDTDIHSPKSINIHPNGKKYYVNSLEGCKTVVFDLKTHRKLRTIEHRFTSAHRNLWNPLSGIYQFTHYKDKDNYSAFSGKPVESAFSHHGRYLWVPYYRRTFDINAQEPSAVAIIDTRNDSIIRLMETGPLPKMIKPSPDGHYMAIPHWGNNTIAMIDISSANPSEWHHVQKFVVDQELKLNFSLTSSVDRDSGSGYALRGTAWTADSRYLLVGCMGGGGGIAVVDMKEGKYLGRILGMKSNLRHLIILDDYLYLSINKDGYVQKLPMRTILDAIPELREKHTVTVTGWQNCKVAPGTRTIDITPDGRYIFCACNFGSKICVVDNATMTTVLSIDADSYPVGLVVSDDGRYVISTSQGRSGSGGNAVDIYRIDRQ